MMKEQKQLLSRAKMSHYGIEKDLNEAKSLVFKSYNNFFTN